MRYGMVIDLKRCIGCYGCQIICKIEHFRSIGLFGARIVKKEFGKIPHVKKILLPLLCMHCKDPACFKVCPSGATTKDEQKGLVLIDSDKCIGCKYCIEACPYGSRYFKENDGIYYGNTLTPYEEMGKDKYPLGTVSKCDFCKDRIEKGLEPSCVTNCMTEARTFGDLDDPESEVSKLIVERGGFQLNPEMGTDPSVYYLPI